MRNLPISRRVCHGRRSIDRSAQSLTLCCVAAPFFDSTSCRRRSCPRRRWLARRARTARNSPVSPARAFHFTIGRGASQAPALKQTLTLPALCFSVSLTVHCLLIAVNSGVNTLRARVQGSLGPCSRPLPIPIFSGSSVVASIHSILPQLPF